VPDEEVEDEELRQKDGEWVHDAETGLDGSVAENESDLTRMSSVTLAPEVRACFRSISSNSERTWQNEDWYWAHRSGRELRDGQDVQHSKHYCYALRPRSLYL